MFEILEAVLAFRSELLPFVPLRAPTHGTPPRSSDLKLSLSTGILHALMNVEEKKFVSSQCPHVDLPCSRETPPSSISHQFHLALPAFPRDSSVSSSSDL